tara:strand:- start:657 stop:1553 length:897 start_codon:yes stop_codon:yes gene_type:complete
MPNFNLDNYETVEDRLKVFWKDNPQARINTEIVHMTDDGTCVTVRAEIYKMEVDARPVTTGIAQETKGQGGFANKDAWVENCETSAIGRALANWLYQGSTKPRPSREEMSKVGNQDDRVKVEKKRVQRPTKEQKEQMNKVVDEMVAEPKTKKNASALKQLMSATVSDADKLKEYQRDAYVECVSELKMPEEVEDWDNEQMTTFLDVFHKLVEKDKGLGDLNEVFVTEDITDKGGDEMGDEWKSNPATEAQLKWCKDIVAKATDKNIDGLAELKKLYNGGDINGETASEIITNWNDKVK